MDKLLVDWNSGHTSLFVLPYELLNLLTQAASPHPITDRGLFWEALKTLKGSPDLKGPSLPKHPTHTGEPLSFRARQQHLFVFYAITTAWQNEHTLGMAALPPEEEVGVVEAWMQLNHLSVWTTQKGQWGKRGESENSWSAGQHRRSGVANLRQVMCSLVTCFPWSLNTPEYE